MKLKEIPASALYSVYLTLTAPAITNRPPESTPALVSLTSIPSRLKTLHLVILSLLAQHPQPKKIILWLNNAIIENTPKKLLNLQSDLFEIRYRPKDSSHRKLIFTLDELPDQLIVTCDDDILYRKGWLAGLLRDNQKHPDCIIAHECRKIPSTNNNECPPYHEWPYCTSPGEHGASLCPIGYGGVLYPPGSLHKDVTNSDLYLKLAPKADDLWFKAMSLKQGTPVRKCSTFIKKPFPIIGAKGNSLAKTNILGDGNRQQWLAICAHYSINPCTLKFF